MSDARRGWCSQASLKGKNQGPVWSMMRIVSQEPAVMLS